MQQPDWHAGVVHGSPSVSWHDVPSVLLVYVQTPVVRLQTPVPGTLQSMSGQFVVCWHPPLASQVSVVQAMPSSQLRAGPPTHPPPLQVSFVVHGLPSLQGALLLVWLQVPDGAEQSSSVHGLPSSQFFGTPGRQLPPLHVSPTVQPLPSLHGPLLLVWTQPPATAGSQLSSVQTFPSSQFFAPLPTQLPPLQTSVVVQGLPSSHGLLLFVCTQPTAGSQ